MKKRGIKSISYRIIVSIFAHFVFPVCLGREMENAHLDKGSNPHLHSDEGAKGTKIRLTL